MSDSQKVAEKIEFLRTLRAVRQFRLEPVPDRAVHDILEVGRWSGSSRNWQPWEFIVVRRRETLQALAQLEGYVKHLAGATLAVVLILDGDPAHFEDAVYDEGRLSERMMLAAAAHGIGSSIGWFAGEGIDKAKALLGVPPDRRLRTALSFGYPDEEARRARPNNPQARKPLSQLVHEERF